MNFKIFLLATLLISSYASDTSDTEATPNIIIGTWIVNDNKADSFSPCCQPSGNVIISNNYNNTVTLTSTNWTGATCGSRSSSYQDLIYVNGGFSWGQLQAEYDNGTQLPGVYDAAGDKIYIDVTFSDVIGTSMTLVYNLNDISDDCYTYYIKSGQVMSVLAGVLIAGLNLIIA